MKDYIICFTDKSRPPETLKNIETKLDSINTITFSGKGTFITYYNIQQNIHSIRILNLR